MSDFQKSLKLPNICDICLTWLLVDGRIVVNMVCKQVDELKLKFKTENRTIHNLLQALSESKLPRQANINNWGQIIDIMQ